MSALTRCSRQIASCCLIFFLATMAVAIRCPAAELRVGAAATELEADDAMVIAGGITAGKVIGQEGRLRCAAVVIELAPTKLAIVA